MIVDEDDRSRVLADCLPEHFARVNQRRIQETARDRDVALQPVLRIENRNVEFLDGEVLQPLAEDLVNIPGTAHRNSIRSIL